MSESIAQSYQECDERTGQSMYSFQSIWMARWTGAVQNATAQARHSPNPFESKKSDDRTGLHESAAGLGNVSNINLSAGGLRNFGTQNHEVINESLGTSSGNIRVESLAHHNPTMSTPCRNGLSLKDGQETHGFELKPHHDARLTSGTATVATKESCLHSVLPVAPAATAISSRKHYCEPEASPRNPVGQVKTHSFFRHGHSVASMPSLDNCRGSASHIVPYRFHHGKFKDDTVRTAMPLLMDRASKNQLPNSSLRMLEGECNYNIHSEPGNSMNVATSSNSHPPELRGDWFHKLQSGSRLAVFRNNCTPFETTEPKKVLHDISMPQELTRTLHDVKTMRICTTVDSVVGLTVGCPKFSQTTHSLLIMKNTDVNICKQNQTAGTSRTCNEFNEKIFNDFDNLSLFLGQNQQGVKLQLLDSSTVSEHEEDIGDAGPSEVDAKNESSAETDTMDIDVFPGKTQLLGVNSSPLKKVCERDQNLPQRTIGSPVEQVGSEGIKNRLPDTDLQLPAIPAEATSIDHLEPSSKTQSLDMESLLAHAEQPSNSKPDLFQFNLLGPEPSSRWVKRLRLSNCDALSLGTRSSNSKEDSSYEKHRFHGKITQGGVTSSEPMTGNHRGKELIAQDKCAGFTGNCESSSTDTMKMCRDLLTSYPWIQRLLRNRAASAQKPEDVVVCKSQSSKLAPEHLQKKQFPSIAAMALMGKATKGFQPCEFQRKGSFVVWNTSGF